MLDMYITMMPLILGGILNMFFTKSGVYKKLNYPIDCNTNWIDGKRVFGDNKTWIGFISMIIICMFTQIIWGCFCDISGINYRNELYLVNDNTIIFNMIVGFLFGFTYMLFELPNSFIKRRLDIKPGKTDKGVKGIFFVIDQIDSLIGVFLVLMYLTGISFYEYINYLILGGITHIVVNLVLWIVKVRVNL